MVAGQVGSRDLEGVPEETKACFQSHPSPLAHGFVRWAAQAAAACRPAIRDWSKAHQKPPRSSITARQMLRPPAACCDLLQGLVGGSRHPSFLHPPGAAGCLCASPHFLRTLADGLMLPLPSAAAPVLDRPALDFL